MLDKLWGGFHDWLTDNRPGFWIGVVVAVVLWCVLAIWMEESWWRRKNERIIFGYAPRLKYSWGVLSIFLIAALAVGILNLLRPIGGFGVIAAWLLKLSVSFLALLFMLGFALWLLRTRQLELDPIGGTWTVRKGWVLSPHCRSGTYDNIANFLLQEFNTWRWHFWRIVLIWKDGTSPYRIVDYRLKRQSIPARIFYFLTGLRKFQTMAMDRTRRHAHQRLHQLGELTRVPTIDDSGL